MTKIKVLELRGLIAKMVTLCVAFRKVVVFRYHI